MRSVLHCLALVLVLDAQAACASIVVRDSLGASGIEVRDRSGTRYGVIDDVVLFEDLGVYALPGLGAVNVLGGGCVMYGWSDQGIHPLMSSSCSVVTMDVDLLCFRDVDLEDAHSERGMILSGCARLEVKDASDVARARHGRYRYGRVFYVEHSIYVDLDQVNIFRAWVSSEDAVGR